MFSKWSDVAYFIVGVFVGTFIAIAVFDKPMKELMACRNTLANPEHCVDYCEKAWSDFYGC